MKINNLYEIHFSPTGGTKETVDIFSAQWSVPKSIIDLADMSVEFDKYEFYIDDLCVIGVPSFGGRVPAVAVQRLRQLKAHNTPAIIIATYGNRNFDDTLIELQEIVEDVGFCVVAALAVVTQHSLLPQIATGRPDALDKKRLMEMSIKIKVHIERALGFKKAKLSNDNKVYKEYKGIPIKPTTTSKCIKCGICAENCPVGAIPLDNPKVTDNEKCISCMRCVRHCPKGARKVSEIKLSLAALKLKKVCSDRKEIEIFINKNISKENIENKQEIIKKVENKLENVAFDTSLDDIEEISVKDISIAEAELDVDDNGLPKKTKESKVHQLLKQRKTKEETNKEVGINADKIIDKNIDKAIDKNQKLNSSKKIIKERPIIFKNEEVKQEVKENISLEVKPLQQKKVNTEVKHLQQKNVNIEVKPLKQESGTKQKLPNTMADINKLFKGNTAEGNKEESKAYEPKNVVTDLEEQKEPEINAVKDLVKKLNDSKIINNEVDKNKTSDLQEISDVEVERPEPEEITVPEFMKGISLDEIENNPYELDDSLLDNDEIEDIMELDEIVDEYNNFEAEDPKDFVLNIDAGLEDIEVKDDYDNTTEEIEDEIGIILEDK